MANVVKTALRKAFFSKRFNKTAVKAYSTLFPPPYLRDNMEFEQDVWNGICAFHSHSGRQVGENNTGPEIYKETIETEHKVCKFQGSRYDREINITALREVMAVWDDSLQFVTLARNDFIRRRGLTNPRFNLRQGYVFSKLGAAVTAYEARRFHNPLADGQLPALETAFFTLGVGPFMVVRALMEKGDLTPLDPEPMTPERLYELADTSGSIVAASGKACAGSPKLFIDILDVAMNGTYAKPLNSVEAHRALAAIGDLDAFYDYVYTSSRLELLVKLCQVLIAQSMQALLAAPGVPAGLKADAEHVLANCYHDPGAEFDAPTVQRNFLSVVLALLQELDHPQAEQALRAAGVLDDISPSATPAELAARVRTAVAVLHPLCVEQLAGVHAALRRTGNVPITLADMERRCGGPRLSVLLNGLTRQPAA